MPDDAARARQLGVDVIACSNHGGRQANGGVPAICHLETVLDAAGDLPVTFDSGIRDGVDVLRAIGLGAALVGIGRPYAYGLAVGGREGLRTVVSQILAEADLTMAVDCYTDLTQLALERLD
jgi:isopentenyl diphosphate isomerase/L-lactate dehydrogenase-like FMN-dependent dehydrogenase